MHGMSGIPGLQRIAVTHVTLDEAVHRGCRARRRKSLHSEQLLVHVLPFLRGVLWGNGQVVISSPNVGDTDAAAVTISIPFRSRETIECLWLLVIATQHPEHAVKRTVFKHEDNDMIDVAQPRQGLSERGSRCQKCAGGDTASESQEIPTPHRGPPSIDLFLSQRPIALATRDEGPPRTLQRPVGVAKEAYHA